MNDFQRGLPLYGWSVADGPYKSDASFSVDKAGVVVSSDIVRLGRTVSFVVRSALDISRLIRFAPVKAPLVHVSAHVIQTEAVGGKRSDSMATFPTVSDPE